MFTPAALHQVLFSQLNLPRRTHFAVAYSGGCDSHVLLHAMAALRRQLDFKLTALHFDHGIAPQSGEWARHCEAVCRQLQICFLSERQTLRKQPRVSLEALARQTRYRWFERVVQPQQVLLTAHHLNDQAETVLLNLLRGGGVDLLAGIPQQRLLSATKATQVVRPLLRFSRAALVEYANHRQLTWVQDPANQADEFDRNYLANSVIPMLEKRWSGAIFSLASGAEHCRETAEFLDQLAAPLLQKCLAPEKMGVFCLAPPLAISALQTLARFQTIRVIRRWLHQHGCRSPSAGQLATLYQQVFAEPSKCAAIHWQQFALRCFAGHLYLTTRLHEVSNPTNTTNVTNAALAWDLRPRELAKNGIRIEVLHTERNAQHAQADTLHLLDWRRLHGKPSQFIWRQGGERMILPGRKHRSKLKKLFQQHAVPPWERNALPLLVVDGEVAWAHGVGVSATYCCRINQPGIHLRFAAAETI